MATKRVDTPQDGDEKDAQQDTPETAGPRAADTATTDNAAAMIAITTRHGAEIEIPKSDWRIWRLRSATRGDQSEPEVKAGHREP